MAKKFFISPTTLNLFIECPRCFWFHMVKGEGFRRPEQPVSTLPRGMDILIKKYFDKYRKVNSLPPEIKNFIEGSLVEEAIINKWRSWQTGLRFIDNNGNQLFGALDECIINNGTYIPVDYKTRGFALKDDSRSYYILQMSCYNFLLQKNNYNISDFAYLIYYVLSDLADNGEAKFSVEIYKVNTLKPQRVYEIFREAIDVLSLQEPPQPGKDCQFCNWVKAITNIDKSQGRLF
ncbi:MAG: PD-(D/E)XK nuclease family protein [Candidatus Omnitrophica bacterium]|nr:PD-(D/E)XK nuclease family protein [Candidatus Omnitrophota bacterium]MCM8831537.1 PD-(D/E)XK nuclease family protein [Candidatus Omnitrophota bacterium]